MKDDAYTLSRFVGDMRGIVGSSATEDELMARLRPLVQQFAGSGTWREPTYAGRPWLLWTANEALTSEASEEPIGWVVARP